MTHRPTPNTPIINIQTRKTLAYWKENGPVIHEGQHYNFAKPLPRRMNFNDMDELMSSTVAVLRVYLIFGKPGDAVQVWGTEETKPEDFDGIDCFAPYHTEGRKAEAQTIMDFLKLRVAKIVNPSELNYLEGYSRSLTH